MDTKSIHRLDWESDFFQQDISIVNDIDLLASEDCAHQQLVMAKVASGDYVRIDKLTELDFQFVESEMRFSVEVNRSTMPMNNSSVAIREANELDIPHLANLASESYNNSRFRQPWFTDGQRSKFYALWVTNAVNQTFDDICLVAFENSEILGFITLKATQQTMSVGLIAVGNKAQGRGVAKSLLAQAQKYTKDSNCTQLNVATQGSNVSAMNLYNSVGFKLIESNYWFYKGKI